AGQTQMTAAVTIKGGTVVEPNESFGLKLTAPTGATIADPTGVGTIINDDTAFTVNDVSITEGQSGSKSMTFTITRKGVTAGTSSVQYKTANGTATAGSDYSAVALTTTSFGPGVTTKTVAVTIKGDVTSEANETLLLLLSS